MMVLTVAVTVAMIVGVEVNVGDSVSVAVDVNVGDSVSVAVDVNVGDSVSVAVEVNVGDSVGVAVDVASGTGELITAGMGVAGIVVAGAVGDTLGGAGGCWDSTNSMPDAINAPTTNIATHNNLRGRYGRGAGAGGFSKAIKIRA